MTDRCTCAMLSATKTSGDGVMICCHCYKPVRGISEYPCVGRMEKVEPVDYGNWHRRMVENWKASQPKMQWINLNPPVIYGTGGEMKEDSYYWEMLEKLRIPEEYFGSDDADQFAGMKISKT